MISRGGRGLCGDAGRFEAPADSGRGGGSMGIHDGHREKMRNRFLTAGLDAFADHEALELLSSFLDLGFRIYLLT